MEQDYKRISAKIKDCTDLDQLEECCGLITEFTCKHGLTDAEKLAVEYFLKEKALELLHKNISELTVHAVDIIGKCGAMRKA